jgi:hypothetical protein
MSSEIDQLVLSSEEWREMLASAAVLDLVYGGYYRAQPRSIRFYAGPDNAPEEWAGGWPDGSPGLARALVGEAELLEEASEDDVVIRLRVSNWAAVRDVKLAFDRGEYRGRFEAFVMAQEAALRGRCQDRAWLRREFHRLRSHSRGTLIND